MLIQEQIKNLKQGDKLLVEAYFVQEGCSYIKCALSPTYAFDTTTFGIHPYALSLPSEYKTVVDARDIFRNMSEGEKASVNNFLSSYFRETKQQEEMRNALKKMGVDLTNIRPKHDPCRLFKKGDKVKRRTVFGRTCNAIGSLGVYTVIEDEKENSGNVIIVDGTNVTYKVKAVFLELVTPVEEMEPYGVEHDDDDKEYSVTCRNKFVCTYPYDSDSFYTKEQAKAAAEAECARLNAEYRKERENG